MKNYLALFFVFVCTYFFSQADSVEISKSTPDSLNANPNYDAALAQKLGGDAYGMKSYYLVILKTGSSSTNDQILVANCFRGHLENINKLVSQGKLVLAGPIGKNDQNFRGIFILQNLDSLEEAHEILQTDPAIQNDLLAYDIFVWYGSAALPEYLPFSDRIWQSKP
jgi:uncharacterized protein